MDTLYEKKCIVNFLGWLQDGFYGVMDFIFSIKAEDVETGLRYKIEYCKVLTDNRTGSRYFYFRMASSCCVLKCIEKFISDFVRTSF